MVFEGSVVEGAAEVERVVERGEGSAEVGAEGVWGPDGAGGEQAGEDRLGANGGTLGSSGDDRDGGAVEVADRAGFVGGILNPLARKGGLDLENRVDALGGDVKAGGVREQQRRVEIIEDGDIDLAGAAAERVDDEGGRGSVTLGEIAIEQCEPMIFGGGSGGGGMLEEAADSELGEHLLLDAVEHFGEVDLAGVGSARHRCGFFPHIKMGGYRDVSARNGK